jgi:hypothetical protein
VFADQALSLIRQWRENAVTPEQRRQKELLDLVDLTAKSRGYSDRARQRLRKEARRCAGNPANELQFVISLRHGDPNLNRPSRIGRPSKGGLW